MKKIKWLLIVLFSSKLVLAQSIAIGTGASIYVGVNADICAGTYGNIIGDITGEGTQCNNSPVPIELSSFTVNVKNISVTLNWETKTEINNYGFEIERKSKESEWKKINFVVGYGNSNSPKEYSYVDKSPMGGSKFQYRLKQIDNDGQFEYSEVVEVEVVPTEFALYQNYPNPFNPSTTIRYQLPKESIVVIKVYNILGAEVMELIKEQKEAGIYEVEFNADNLSSGTYIIRIVADNFVETRKMILLK